MRIPRFRTRWLAVLLAAGTTALPARAQDTTSAPSPGTHAVKKGDTLWDIARQYLGDPFLWPEVYRLNTDVVDDPHWIYPGEQLRIPGNVQTVAEDQMARPDEPVPDAPTPRSPVGGTVFAASQVRRLATASRFGGTANEYPHSAVRAQEVYAAPWIDRTGGPQTQGRVVGPVDIPGIVEPSPARVIGPQSRAYVTVPKGLVLARGDRLVVFHLGPSLDGGSQVVIPTGIVEVEQAEDGDASVVRVVQQFHEIAIGDGVMPLDRLDLAAEARPAPLAQGTEAHVVYIPSQVVLPSLLYYVLLDATQKDGVKVGDQFTLYRPRQRVEVDDRGTKAMLPEERIALAQVVKVTDRGTTALIVDQAQPSIKEGARARLTARMP